MKGQYIYYGANGPIDSINSFSFEGQFILLAEDGTVRTPDGHPVLTLTASKEKFWVSNHAHVIRPLPNIDVRYLYYALQASNIDEVITGAVQPKVSQENMKRIKVLLHAPDEMHHIVDAMPILLRESS